MGVLFVIAAVLAAEEEVPPPTEPPAPPPVEERQRAPLEVTPSTPEPVQPEALQAVQPEPPPPEPVEPRPAPAPTHALGSAKGPWGYGQAGMWLGSGTFVDPSLYAATGMDSYFAGGWGFAPGNVRIVPSLAFGWGATFASPGGGGLGWTPVRLRLSAPDVFEDKWVTGIRVMPVIGATIPTGNGSLLTALTLGVRLSRRFGPIEVMYRADAARNLYGSSSSRTSVAATGDTWSLVNTFLFEAWFAPWVSAAVGFALYSGWQEVTTATGPFGPSPSPQRAFQRNIYDTTVQLNFAPHKYLGVSISMDTTMPTTDTIGRTNWFPFYAFGREAQSLTSFAVRFWFRSDELIQRNWLDR